MEFVELVSSLISILTLYYRIVERPKFSIRIIYQLQIINVRVQFIWEFNFLFRNKFWYDSL